MSKSETQEHIDNKNIYQRINEVRKKVTYVQKDAKVTGYKAVSHDQVTAVLRESMVEQGIVVAQSLISSSFKETGDLTAKGTKWHLYQAKYSIKFINVDDPKDYLKVTTEAQALDHGDKAIGKAMSYAVKYAMLKTFSLETGDDDEGRQDDFKQKREGKEPITPEQAQELEALITDKEADRSKFLIYLAINDIEELRSDRFNQAKQALAAKK